MVVREVLASMRITTASCGAPSNGAVPQAPGLAESAATSTAQGEVAVPCKRAWLFMVDDSPAMKPRANDVRVLSEALVDAMGPEDAACPRPLGTDPP